MRPGPHSAPTDAPPCHVRHLDVRGFHVVEIDPVRGGENPDAGAEGADAAGRPGRPDRLVYFAHATGIASETYLDLLRHWARLWNARIYAYDARGFGRTSAPVPPTRGLLPRVGTRAAIGTREIPDLLVADACDLFWELQGREIRRARSEGSAAPPWTFAGHSLGGWLQLHAAVRCHVRHLVLLDISILPYPTATLWALACAFGQRKVHTLAKRARVRKRRYRSAEEAKRVFRRLPFFKGWDAVTITRYVEANYVANDDGFVLRHDPMWEARLYESQHASAALSFLSLGQDVRERLDVLMVVGGASDACDPGAGRFFLGYFPRARWVVLPDAGHMYPFSRPASLLAVLETLPPEGVRPACGDKRSAHAGWDTFAKLGRLPD